MSRDESERDDDVQASPSSAPEPPPSPDLNSPADRHVGAGEAPMSEDGPVLTTPPGVLASKLPPRPGSTSPPDRHAGAGEAPTDSASSESGAETSPPPGTSPHPGAGAGETPQPQLVYGNVDEFVRNKLRYLYARRVSPQGGARWSAEWWRYPEAISRLDALWRAWEALRLDATLGISVWWRDHADHHMRMLMNPEGPFADSQDKNAGDGDALPYKPPPAGMFLDVREM